MPDEGRTGIMEAGARDSSGTPSSKPPDIVVTKKAFQMAQAWVMNMTGGVDAEAEEDDESTTTEAYGGLRPARLGLGAKYVPHSQAARIMSPVEKKLRAKINAARQGDAAGDHDRHLSALRREATTSEPDRDEEEGNDGNDSKTSAFGRKQRNTTANLLLPTSKAGKRKRLGR